MSYDECMSHRKEPGTSRAKEFIKETLSTLLVAIILALIIKTFLFEARVIPSGSMLPTIQINDRVLVNKLVYHWRLPERFEIIVFHAPETRGGESEDFIKRVIAFPGETVAVKNGKVSINGKPLEEPMLNSVPNYSFGPVKVPEDCLFVLGDNRNFSFDSHLWNHWLETDMVKGKAFWCYWPLNRFGPLS
jgi:signal peptidase I